MLLKPLIYVSRVTNLSDARYCAGMGVDMLGFMIDPASADYVSPSDYQAMVGWISGPKRVVEVGASTRVHWSKVIEEYKPDLVHIRDTSAMTDLPTLPLLLEIPFAELPSRIEEILKLNLSVEHIMVTQLPESAAITLTDYGFSTLLSIGVQTLPLQTLLSQTGASGFALQGSPELAPGLKDYDHLSKVLEELEG